MTHTRFALLLAVLTLVTPVDGLADDSHSLVCEGFAPVDFQCEGTIVARGPGIGQDSVTGGDLPYVGAFRTEVTGPTGSSYRTCLRGAVAKCDTVWDGDFRIGQVLHVRVLASGVGPYWTKITSLSN